MGHLHNEIVFSHKKKRRRKVLPFATVWIDLEKIMLSEISQSEKDKYYDFTHVESHEQSELKRKMGTDS